MKLTKVRESHEYFTQATGTRCRDISYAGIAAVWVLKEHGGVLSPWLISSLFFFATFLFFDMLVAYFCATDEKALIRKHEIKEHNRTGSLPDEHYEFEYAKAENSLSDTAFTMRPWWIGLGYVPLVVQLGIMFYKGLA